MEEVIVLKHVSKYFKEAQVLKNVSVTFEKGKIHGVIGRNGSGKTVMFKAICGFISIEEGSVWVRGKNLEEQKDVILDMGIIIDQAGFIPYYSGFKNLKFLASLNKRISDEQIKRTITKVGLDPLSKKHVSKYSMGMKQRLSIAQAIMEDQDIIILDEPMNGLDKDGVKEIRALLLTLKDEGKTIILASHNTQDIEALCEKVYEMDNGILIQIK